MAFLVNGTTIVDNSIVLSNITGTDSATMTALAVELVTENTVATGTTVRAIKAPEVLQTGTSFITAWDLMNVVQRGSITLAADLRVSNASGPGAFLVTRYRNGTTSTVWSQTFSNTAYAEYTSDQNILPGDQFLFQLRGGSYVSGKSTINTTGYAKDMEIRTSSGSIWIPVGVNSWYHNYS